jgi:16S rRNA (adenine1518-N6/adenine1519-N6)-dimethyltransferase
MSSLYNINYLKHLCKKYGLIPSKKYGQNFLIHPVKSPQGGMTDNGGQFNGVNEESTEKMLEAAEIKKEDTVVEIGPGFGVLTLALAEKAEKVLVFEIEKKLEPYWQEQISRHKNIEIVWGNVLKYPISNIQYPNYKVIANLPYQITSNVIRKFLEAENKPELMVLMVQKEVAERICAKPGDMSVLAVSVQCYADAEIVMQVPKSYFWPVPKVDSAIIKLSLRRNECLYSHLTKMGRGGVAEDGATSATPPNLHLERGGNDEQFFKIVKVGFANRRKMLIKNLSSVADKTKLPAIFQELKISEKVRAQELSVEQWRQLVHKV